MADTLQLKVVTPSGSALDETVLSVTACSEIGEFCVLPQHVPILASLKPGRMIVEKDGEKVVYAVDRGFIEGGPDHVNVITENCVSAKEIDMDELRASISTLETSVPDAENSGIELDLAWARARLEVAEKNGD